MGTAQTRQNKVEWMMSKIRLYFLHKPDGSISQDKLLSEFALHNATTRRTGLDILDILEQTGMIKIKGEEVFLRK